MNEKKKNLFNSILILTFVIICSVLIITELSFNIVNEQKKDNKIPVNTEVNIKPDTVNRINIDSLNLENLQRIEGTFEN